MIDTIVCYVWGFIAGSAVIVILGLYVSSLMGNLTERDLFGGGSDDE